MTEETPQQPPEQPANIFEVPEHERTFFDKYQFWVIGILCALALAYEVYSRLTAPTVTELLEQRGMMPLFQAAYSDKAELARDFKALDALGEDSWNDALDFLYDSVYPKVFAAYRDAVINAPQEALEENYRLSRDMVQKARSQAPELCRVVLDLDVDFADLPAEIPPAVLAELVSMQKARFVVLANIISAAHDKPTPLEIPEKQAVATYDMAYDRIIAQQNLADTLARAKQDKATQAENCTLIDMAVEAVEVVPDYQRPLILKGMMLAPFVYATAEEK